MSVYTIFSWLSLLKRKLYCNIESIVYIKDDEDIPDIHPKIKIEYKVISDASELEKYSNNKKIKMIITKFGYFLNHGCKIYFSLHNGDIAGHYLISKLSSSKPYLYLNHPLFQGDNSYYIFFCHTFDEYRGEGIYSYILTEICKNTIINRKGKVFISTEMKNIASQKGIKRAGWLELGVLKYKRVGCVTVVNTFKTYRENGITEA